MLARHEWKATVRAVCGPLVHPVFKPLAHLTRPIRMDGSESVTDSRLIQ